MWILFGFQAIAALWTFFDAHGRKHYYAILWALGAFTLPFIFVPIHWTRRNLHHGEAREGGTAWVFCKCFAAMWTAWVIVAGLVIFFDWTGVLHRMKYSSQSGAVFGFGIMGFFLIFLFWLIVAAIVLIVGRILKRPDAVEKGPTGDLAAMDEPGALKGTPPAGAKD